MSRRPERLLLEDMIARIDRVHTYLANIDRVDFLQDTKTSDAVVRNLEVIGEAPARLSKEFCSRHVQVPWHRIVGLRNRVVHEYFAVDLDLVWEIASRELSGLRTQLERALLEQSDSD